MNRRYFAISGLTMLCPDTLSASIDALTGDDQAFEVAVARRVLRPSSMELSPTVSGNRLLFESAPLVAILSFAFDVKLLQIAGSYPPPPGDMYRVEGVASKPAGREEFRGMMRTLLKQRFSLRSHWEEREYSVRELIVNRQGPRISVGSHLARAPRGKEVSDHTVANYGALVEPHAFAKSVTMEQFADFLVDFVNEPVVDRTLLTGTYSFDISWTSEDGIAMSGPGMTLEEALSKTLGLSLKRGRARIRTLVVEHVSEPTDN